LYKKMLDQDLPAHVDDERDLGTNRGDVREVLFRPTPT
jgi:hypothetical protein